MNLSLIGVPGSGKGTQAKLLSDKLGLYHINVGALFRDEINKMSELGIKVEKIVKSGKLVSNEIVFELLKPHLNPRTAGNIFDGFPRTVRQAEHLMKKIKLSRVYFFELRDDVAVKRLHARRICPYCGQGFNLLYKKPENNNHCDSCNVKLILREDDKEEAIKLRLEEFHKNIDPLIDFFEKRKILSTVDASQSPGIINRFMLESLTP